MGGAGVPTTGEETDDMLPMNPEGYKVDDAQVQYGHLLTNAYIGQTPYNNLTLKKQNYTFDVK
ncbi:hypothetical protein Mjas_06985 [Methanothermococcus sp. Ax23]|uniref:hypothetical protein n=1 Tax=Methanothermococcus sp. Ax23 TaxID=3156486 RepID=UPI003B9EACAC